MTPDAALSVTFRYESLIRAATAAARPSFVFRANRKVPVTLWADSVQGGPKNVHV